MALGTEYATHFRMDYIEKWRRERKRNAFLALADGTVFRGVAFGARRDALGEVVFNTGMSGYQEILTDPSYAGQFVTLTAAEIGNYGANGADIESRALFLSGLVIGDLAEPSNWRSEKSLDEYLKENNVPGIYGVDTRALTIHLREHGNCKAFLCVTADGDGDDAAVYEKAVAKAREWEGLDGQDYAAKVTCEKPYELENAANVKVLPSPIPSSNGTVHSLEIGNISTMTTPHIVCYDFGVKMNILRSLAAWAHVTVVPAKTPAEDVLALKPDGVFLSNGPADPAAVTYAIDNIRKLLGASPNPPISQSPNPPIPQSHNPTISQSPNLTISQSHNHPIPQSHNLPISQSPNPPIPLMGICLGHQLLALACGAKTGRLKFGHHGCNHPVKNLATGKVEITSQNHNFAVVEDSMPECLEVTHVNLNDGTIEGVRHKTLPAFSVQYHPESCPGPHDSKYLFDQFKKMVFDYRQTASDNGCRPAEA